MTEKDTGLERLTNLTFAFLNAKRLGRQFLTTSWVRRNVDGYADGEKLFQRDRAVLMKVGVPIEAVADAVVENGEKVTGYRLQEEDYSLPEVSFTPEEASLLALAGERGMTGELSAFARSGWTKIAASGITQQFGDPGAIGTVGDLHLVKAKTLDQVIGACTSGRGLTFDYQQHKQATIQHRRMDPWGLVPLRGRMYLVGFDLDRGAERSFRITRLSNIVTAGPVGHPRPDNTDLQHIVETAMRQGQELVSATLKMSQGVSPELEAQGERRGEEVILRDVEKQWLVRECIAAAPDVIVLTPPDVRDAVIAGITATLEVH